MSEKSNITIPLTAIAESCHSFPDELNDGYKLHQTGRLFDAKAHYRAYLQANPYSVYGLLLYGIAEMQHGNLSAAISLISRAIKLDSGCSVAHIYLGYAYKAASDNVNAAVSFLRADVSGYNGGNGLFYTTINDMAEGKQKKLLKYRVDLFLKSGDINEALNSSLRLLGLDRNDPESWNAFSLILSHISFDHVISDSLMSELTTVFTRDDVNHKFMVAAGISALSHLPDFSPVFKSNNNAHELLEIISNEILSNKLNAIAGNKLLLAMLEKSLLADERLEKWLTAFRYAALNISLSNDNSILESDLYIEFLCALSHQCFLGEYVYFESLEEKQLLTRLIDAVKTRIPSNHPVPASWIIVVSLYRMLNGLDIATCLLDSRWPIHVERVLKCQIRDPMNEHVIRSEITQATSICDDVSMKVRQQYEENPFPRWDSMPGTVQKKSLNDLVLSLFPYIDKSSLVETACPDILVAGCGTGWIPVVLSTQVDNARITAIDLSLSSLSYAIRKTREFGVDNIEYAQGDILRLRELNKEFDHINCFGVLHHMDNTLDGFRVLNDILRPGCTMLIGLYSKIAREIIYSAREYIQEKAYEPTPDSMRRCRKDIFEMDADSGIRKLSQSLAFYSMSEFRDTVFHVQEHCLTIPELEQMIEVLGLQFLGFEIYNPVVIQQYRSRFPDDPSMTSLVNWHEFELDNPETFIATYRFWVQKKIN